MTLIPPRLRPEPSTDPVTLADPDCYVLNPPTAYGLHAQTIGYHVPKALANAAKYSDALTQVR